MMYTRYPEPVMLGLIYCFWEGVEDDKRITPLEALLLINWSNSSLNLIRRIKDLFDKQLFEASLEVFLFELDQDIEWTPENIAKIESQIELRRIQRMETAGRLSVDLLPLQDLIQRLEIMLKELKS